MATPRSQLSKIIGPEERARHRRCPLAQVLIDLSGVGAEGWVVDLVEEAFQPAKNWTKVTLNSVSLSDLEAVIRSEPVRSPVR